MEILDSRMVYESPWLSLREDAVRRSDGSAGVHVVLDGPDLVLVVPVEDDRVHLVVQHRHPLGRESLEFASGTAEPDDADSEEGMRSEWFTRDEVATMVREGRLVDAKSLGAYALLLTLGH